MEKLDLSELRLSGDGRTMIIAARLGQETTTREYAISYTQAVALAKGIISSARGAVARQEANGGVEATPLIGDVLQSETLDLLIKPGEKQAALVALGTWSASSAPGTTTLLVDSAAALKLIGQLQEFVQGGRIFLNQVDLPMPPSAPTSAASSSSQTV
jgi:hypothetical protein